MPRRRRAPPPAAGARLARPRLAGAAVDGSGRSPAVQDTPPITRFLAEQLTTAHWFDQRRTREVLGWAPEVDLDAGFARLAAWYAAQDVP